MPVSDMQCIRNTKIIDKGPQQREKHMLAGRSLGGRRLDQALEEACTEVGLEAPGRQCAVHIPGTADVIAGRIGKAGWSPTSKASNASLRAEALVQEVTNPL